MEIRVLYRGLAVTIKAKNVRRRSEVRTLHERKVCFYFVVLFLFSLLGLKFCFSWQVL